MSQPLNTPPHIASLRAYVPGLPISDLAQRLNVQPSQIAKLASNENPFGASPKALQALTAAQHDVSRYPDNDCKELIASLAAHHCVSEDWIVAGAGSESVIGNAVATLLDAARKTSYAQYSFQAYVNAVQRIGATSIVVPSPDFTVDLEGLGATLKESPSLIYIANPGNPTGTCLDPDELFQFLKKVPQHVTVLLDEAYYEFLPETMRTDSVEWVSEFSNLLVTRTFSKAYGLAGLRVGYGIAQKPLSDMLRRVRPPFTVTQQAQVAAAAALQDTEFLRKTISNNNQCRQLLVRSLNDLGIRTVESHTNFVLANVGDGMAWSNRLERHALIVRPVNSYALPEWVRISIGTPEDTARVIHAFQQETTVTS